MRIFHLSPCDVVRSLAKRCASVRDADMTFTVATRHLASPLYSTHVSLAVHMVTGMAAGSLMHCALGLVSGSPTSGPNCARSCTVKREERRRDPGEFNVGAQAAVRTLCNQGRWSGNNDTPHPAARGSVKMEAVLALLPPLTNKWS